MSKVDWKIYASELTGSIWDTQYMTNGYGKYGFGEVLVCGMKKNCEKITGLINTFCRMQKDGEVFEEGCVHCIDNPDGKNEYKFALVRLKRNDNGESFIQLYPDFEMGGIFY